MILEAFGYDLDPAEWTEHAACTGMNPNLFFPERGAATTTARAICQTCTVQTDCLDYALRWRIQFGIWGGTSSRERQHLPKPPRVRRPRPHGTTARYAAGCRCNECRWANREYNQWRHHQRDLWDQPIDGRPVQTIPIRRAAL